jgi:hypothetical protein
MLPSGKVLVVGGGNNGNAVVFDPAGAGSWAQAAFPGHSRAYQTAALLTTLTRRG